MGVNRYPSGFLRRHQEYHDFLQWRCRAEGYSLTIGELREAGVKTVKLECLGTECGHRSAELELVRFGGGLTVSKFRRLFVCDSCGTHWPQVELQWDESRAFEIEFGPLLAALRKRGEGK